MTTKTSLRRRFNVVSLSSSMIANGKKLMADACKPGLLAGSCVVGLAVLGASATFGLSAAFAAVAFAAPTWCYGYGAAVKFLGTRINRLNPTNAA